MNEIFLKNPAGSRLRKAARVRLENKLHLSEANGILEARIFDPDLFIGERQSRRLRAEVGWFEKLVRHAPTVGSFYEDALRGLLSEHLGGDISIGTGFIFDELTRSASKQFDIISFHNSEAPLYKAGNFFVINPAIVHSLIEVKKTLTSKLLRELVVNTFNVFSGWNRELPSNAQRLYIFAYKCIMSNESIMRAMKAGIEKAMQDLSPEAQSGGKVRVGQIGVTIPCLFLLDRNRYFLTELIGHPKLETGYEVRISEFQSHSDDSLPELIASVRSGMLKPHGEISTNLLTPPYRKKITSQHMEDPILLCRRVSMRELAEVYFPSERERIASFRYEGMRAYGAMLSSRHDLPSIGSFSKFCSIEDILWLTVPE
ncbi:MAG: DUF6602 domain-containing protein [Amaricoccus sp.]